MSDNEEGKETTALETVRSKLTEFQRIKEAEPAVSGVSAGLAYRLKVPTSTIRFFWLFSVAMTGFNPALLIFPVSAYIGLWFMMPEAEKVPEDFNERTGGK